MHITYMRIQQTIALARIQMKLETAPKGYLDFITLKAGTLKADSKGSNIILGINGTLSFTTSLL